MMQRLGLLFLLSFGHLVTDMMSGALPVRLSDNARIKRDRKGDSPAPALSFHEALLKREGDS